MGGTFDPIHLGHLITADRVLTELNLDEIIFIPAAVPPHKQGNNITEAAKRYIMTTMATADNPRFSVSDIELKRKGPSYTKDTIDELKKTAEDSELYLIIGADEANDLDKWYNADEILAKCHIVAAMRQGTAWNRKFLSSRFGGALADRIIFVKTPELEISSTEIRRRIKKGLSVRYLMPTVVINYIKKERLYL